MLSTSNRGNNNNNNNSKWYTDSLGVIPTQRLLKDLEKISQAKHFLEEYHSLLEDDCNEYERHLTLHAAATSNSKKSHASTSSFPVIPLAQYMIVPLSLVRLIGGDETSNDDWLMKYLSASNNNNLEEHKIEAKFLKLFSCNSSNSKNCLWKPLQIVFISPLPATTFEQRRLQREKFRVARAHQEREAYNRMLRGNYEGSVQTTNSSNSVSSNKTTEDASLQTMTERLFENVLFKQQVDPKKNPATVASAMRLKATSGGAGFLAKDAFSSSSRQEMESIAGMSAKCSDAEVAAAAAANGGDSMMKKISRDIGLGLDVPLMALAGAVVGWYACSLRGFSSNESAIGAAVCATIMLIVDGGLVMMKLAREDLKSTKEKKRREEELKKAVKTSMATTMGTAAERSKMVADEHERKKQNYRVISREVVSETAIDDEGDKEKQKEAKKTK